MNRISVIGLGGQGIALLGLLIGSAATLSGKYVSVHSSYGAEVRGGRVETRIIISDKPIVNPYTQEIDLYIILHNVGWKHVSGKEGNKIYADEDLAYSRDIKVGGNIKYLPMNKISMENNVPINMVVLGLLVKLGILNYENVCKALELRGILSNKNIKGLKIGMKITI